jgi:serine-type D-Ala-D-Ala carboxypeptidase/endopeptidase (penicillin-binding protein 4)
VKIISIVILFILSVSINAQVDKIITDWKNDQDLKNASIGFCILNSKTSEVISEFNSHTSLIPASALKIVTTSAALGVLGENFHFETKIYYDGIIDKQTGILNGNLIIVGNGDPTLQSEYFYKDGVLITDKWAKIIKDKGIKTITGKIIGDASYFPRTVPDHWIWGDIGNYFGAVPCGLSFMDNKFKLKFNSFNTDSEAKIISTFPNYFSHSYSLTCKVVSKGKEDEAYVYGDPFSYTKTILGTIPPNKLSYEVEAALPDPALLCAEQVFNSLINSGVKADIKKIESNYGTPILVDKPKLIYTHLSPSLEKIIYYTNLNSNNQYCESILLILGKGNRNKGIEVVKNYWQSRGLTTNELFMVDGSGLSRANTITPFFQANVCAKIFRDSLNYKIIYHSLPIAGKSGSMSNLGKGTFIENNMHAKTGYINRVRGYCGYFKSKSGKEISFSVLFNNYTFSPREAKNKLERFLVEIGNY